MSLDSGLVAWIGESMAPIGTVTHRAMMGGATLYCDGVVFAIISAEGQFYFKADKVSDAAWDAAGCPRFTFDMAGKTGSMNYRLAPDDCHDDADALRQWALLGLAAGGRSPPKKPRKPRKV